MRLTIVAAAVGALALTGCDQVMVNNAISQPTYRQGEEDFASRLGAIRVEVVGETFGLAPDQFASLVVGLMRSASHHPEKTMFTTEASRETDPRYKIVVMFNPANAVSGDGLCYGAQPTGPRPPGSVKLMAVFCGGNELLSESTGRAGAIMRVEDPHFPELVRAVTMDLFPLTDVRESTGTDM